MNPAGPNGGRTPDARAVALDLLGSVFDRNIPLDAALAHMARVPPRSGDSIIDTSVESLDTQRMVFR